MATQKKYTPDMCYLHLNEIIREVKWVRQMASYDLKLLGLRDWSFRGFHRICLLTLLFPSFSLALCAWLTVFGFYLRLEDRAKRKRKRDLAKLNLERSIREKAWQQQYQTSLETLVMKSNRPNDNTSFVNLAFQDDEMLSTQEAK